MSDSSRPSHPLSRRLHKNRLSRPSETFRHLGSMCPWCTRCEWKRRGSSTPPGILLARRNLLHSTGHLRRAAEFWGLGSGTLACKRTAMYPQADSNPRAGIQMVRRCRKTSPQHILARPRPSYGQTRRLHSQSSARRAHLRAALAAPGNRCPGCTRCEWQAWSRNTRQGSPQVPENYCVWVGVHAYL